ncbi:MAG: zinc ribbon domain-containing protein [Sandaracinaceae bacterium]|nr:zinc ribbon domain-containing protein [Sandaracinaceae bacterium]
MIVTLCDDCGGALGPSAERPPCLCRLEPVALAPDAPEAKGTKSEARALRCPSCGAFVESGVRRCGHCRVELASVRCWCCFALAFAGTDHCARCGSRLGLEGDLGPTQLRCPGCDGDVLHVIDVGEHRIAECPACTGVLVDHATLEAITHAREAEAGVRMLAPASAPVGGAAAPVVYRRCPTCGKHMNRQNFGRASGVIVDVCKEHGVFFDAHELTAVLEFVASGGMARTRAREVEAAKAELAKHRLDALLEQQRAARAHATDGKWASSGAFISALGGTDWWF